MASDSCPSGNPKVKVRRRSQDRKRKKVQAEEVQGLTSAGHTALQEGRPQEALRHLSHALEAAGQLQDSRVIRACSFNLGAAHVEAGHAQKGLEFLRRAQPGPKADRLPDLQYNLGQAHNALGQDREAVGHFLRAAQLYRSQGDGGSEGHACLEMGRCHHRTQDWAPAAQAFLRAAESFRLAAMLDSAALALKEAGSVMIQSDQFSRDDIIGVLNDCLSETDRITDAQMQGELYLSVGVSFCQLHRFPEALGCFQAALGPMAERPPLLAKALHNLGATLNALGQFTPALQYHRLAAALYGSLGCRGDQAWCFRNLALALSRLGEEEEAAESLGHALQSFRDTGPAHQCGSCVIIMGCYGRVTCTSPPVPHRGPPGGGSGVRVAS
ncbi:tetratricopeptide repeat protein 24 [Antennarius striatus]|uniref:tetratricopeptide repeat protein 24 n=1 Tax=Antennarius striatus TaxID=241820 RepID=UPI0035AEFEED